MNKIHFFNRREIDDIKWNDHIGQSLHSLPYAFAWYLDAVAENWSALILNNYEAVMPLPWMRKLGVKCVYQPYYCQQLGVFSRKAISADVHINFLKEASTRFAYVNTNLNPEAAIVSPELRLRPKLNLLLDLEPDYAILQKKYSGNQKRNIAKAQKAGLLLDESCSLKIFQKFYLENVNREKENFKDKHEKIFKKLSQILISGQHAHIFSAVDHQGQLLAAALLIRHQNRFIGIINTSSKAGKSVGAAHFLFDQVIQKFSKSGYTLDFEGSSIVSIARFYQGFGAREECFYNYKNTLLKRLGQRFG